MDGNMSYIIIAVLAVVVLLLSLKVMKQNKKQNELVEEKKETIEEKRDAALESMTENIYDLTKNLMESKDTENKALESAILNSANNLRELLKIKSDKVEIFYETFSFSQMLDDIITNMVPNFKGNNTELVFEVEHNVPASLTTDLVHLSRIINNILEFSMVATPKGTVSLKAWTNGKTNPILNIEIKDSSEGMDSEALKNIFSLSHDDQTGEHVGLALYIAKELSSHMGGRLEAKSKEGQGNVFLVAVPIELAKEVSEHDKGYLLPKVKDKKVLLYGKQKASVQALKMLLSLYYKQITIADQLDMEKMRINFAQYDLLVLDESYFTHKKADHLALIKRSRPLQIVSYRSIFAKEDIASYTCIDSTIEMPMTQAKMKALVAYLEDHKEDVVTPQSSYIGDLAVYKSDIEETEGIDQHDFKDFSSARLLIVEDNLINQKILLGVLKNAGMQIDIANNGQEALDILFEKQKRYDIVLMDISMPVMDGETATRKIREKTEFNNMPIVTFTAFSLGKEIEQMFMVGVNAYLTKPLNIKKLYTVFKYFLGDTHREHIEKEPVQSYAGLDIEKGISWADENEMLYKETLKEFVSVYGDSGKEISRLVDEKAYDKIKLLCREMQGMLTFIGAFEMKNLIDEIQGQLMSDNSAYENSCKKKYPETLNKLIENIDHYIES